MNVFIIKKLRIYTKFSNNQPSWKKFPCFYEGGGSIFRNYVFVKNKAMVFFSKTFRKVFFWNKKKVFSQNNFSFFFLLQNLVTLWGQHKIFLDKKNIFFIFFKKNYSKLFGEKKIRKTIFFWKIFVPCFYEGEGSIIRELRVISKLTWISTSITTSRIPIQWRNLTFL